MTPKNFSALILNLYKEGHITFDDDLRPDYTATAVIEIQEFIRPVSIFNIELDDTLAITALRSQEKEQREANDAAWGLKDAQAMRENIKSIAASAFDSFANRDQESAQ